MKPETIAIHAGYESEATTKAVAVPIYQTVAYEFDNAQHGADLFNLTVPGNIYTPRSRIPPTMCWNSVSLSWKVAWPPWRSAPGKRRLTTRFSISPKPATI